MTVPTSLHPDLPQIQLLERSTSKWTGEPIALARQALS